MADRLIKHCGRAMVHLGRGLLQCADCGHTEAILKEQDDD